MKKICLVACLIVLLLSFYSLRAVVDKEIPGASNEQILSPNNDPDQEIEKAKDVQETAANSEAASENTNGSYAVNLAVDGGYLQLRIPIGYQLQEYELSEIEEYPFSYVFIDEDANSQFIVYSTLDNEKNQGIRLRKLYDKSNKYVVFDDILIGEHTYIAYTNEQTSFDYGFLMRAANGLSYHFQYILPHDANQNEIPAEAISILSTLRIQESAENID